MATLDLAVGSSYLAKANAVAEQLGVPADLDGFFSKELTAISAIVSAGKDLGMSGIGAITNTNAEGAQVASAPANKSGPTLA